MASRRVLRDEDLRLNIILDGKQVPKENKKLLSELGKLERAGMDMERAYARLAKQQKQLQAIGANNRTQAQELELIAVRVQMDALNDAMRDNALQQRDMRNQIGLTGMTLNQLRTHLQLLQIEQSNIRGDRQTWNALQQEIDRTNYQIRRLTTNSSWLGMMWDDVAKKANKYGAAIGAIGLVVYQVTAFIEKFTGDLKELEDTMAGVRRTTGLSRDMVLELKTAFDKMDTRTAAIDLLEMAKVGGKLGVEGKSNILGFVDAMDKLQVALGEDLTGEGGSIDETAKSVGKLVQNFGMVGKDVNLNEALLRAGSLLNELDKTSTAAASGILEFTSRLSGVAPTVGMSIDQVAGIGAFLDSAGVSAELGATAIQRMLLKMGQNATDYAKIMGMSVEQYKKSTEEDINGTFLNLIEKAAAGKVGVVGLAKAMGDLGVDEQRAIMVIGKLAEGLDIVKKRQGEGAAAVANSNSIMEEYNITNENFTAELEKQEKRLTALRNEIGIELEPAVVGVKKAYVDFMYLLRDAGEWIKEHWKMISVAAIAFTTYKVNVLLAARGLTTFGAVLRALISPFDILRLRWMYFVDGFRQIPTTTGRVKYAFTALFNVMKANPFLVLTTAIAGAVALFIIFNRKTFDASKALKEFDNNVKEIRKSTAEFSGEEKAKMAGLFDELKKNWADTKKRKTLIDELNKTYPGYIKNLDAEKTALGDVKKIQEEANEALTYNIALKRSQAERDRIIEESLKSQEKLMVDYRNEVEKQTGASEKAGFANIKLFQILKKMEGIDPDIFDNALKSTTTIGIDASGAQLQLEQRKKAIEKLNAKGMSYQYEVVDPITTLSKETNMNYQTTLDLVVAMLRIRKAEAKELENTSGFYKEILSNLKKEIDLKSKDPDPDPDPDPIDNEATLKDIEQRNKTQLVMLKKRLNDELDTKEQYDEKVLRQELKYQKQIMGIKNLEKDKLLEAQSAYEDARTELAEFEKKKKLDALEDEYNKKLQLHNEAYLKEQEIETGGGAKADEERNKAQLLLIEAEYLKLKLELNVLNAKEREAVEKAYLDKMLEIYEMQNKAEKDLTSDTIRNKKQARKEYRQMLQDEMRALKEAESLFGQSIMGNVILLDKQKALSEKVKQDELDILEEQLKLGEIKYKVYLARKEGIEQEHQRKLLQTEQERKIDSVKLAMDWGKEFAQNWGQRYAERIKMEDELHKQLLNKEITLAEYQKKMNEIRTKNQKEFFKDLLIMLLKSLQMTANAYLAEAGIKNIGKYGLVKGAIKTAIEAAVINSTFEIAKAKIQSTQFAKGKYPVMGADDNRTYHPDYVRNLQTGIYNNPKLALFNENPRLPEMVVDGATTQKLRFNYPDMYNWILSLAGKGGRTRQFAAGEYPEPTGTGASAASDPQMIAVMQQVAVELARLRTTGVNANVDIYKIDDALTEIYDRKAAARG